MMVVKWTWCQHDCWELRELIKGCDILHGCAPVGDRCLRSGQEKRHFIFFLSLGYILRLLCRQSLNLGISKNELKKAAVSVLHIHVSEQSNASLAMTLSSHNPAAFWKGVCVLSHFSCVQFFVTPWTVAHQAPLSMGFSRQEYWSGFSCPPPGDLSYPGIKPASLMSPALAAEFFTTSAT